MVRILSGIVLLGVVFLPEGVVHVPGEREALTRLGDILAGIAGVLLPALVAPPDPELEASSARSLLPLRLTWSVAIIGLSGVVLAAVLNALSGPDALVVWRNHLLMCGISLITLCAVGVYLAWLPGFVFLAVSLMYGTQDYSVTARPWAVLQQGSNALAPAALAAVIFAAGIGLYVSSDARGRGSVSRTW